MFVYQRIFVGAKHLSSLTRSLCSHRTCEAASTGSNWLGSQAWFRGGWAVEGKWWMNLRQKYGDCED